MELDIEELKILLVNLSSKLDRSTDEIDKESINKKIESYKVALSDRYQSNINKVFKSIVDMCSSDTELSLSEFKDDMLLKLNEIMESQKELQGVDDVQNIYFTHLVIPRNQLPKLNKTNLDVQSVPLTTQSLTVTKSVVDNSEVLSQPQSNVVQEPVSQIPSITDPEVLRRLQILNSKNVIPPVVQNINASKRSTVEKYISFGDFDGLYKYLRDSNYRVITTGVEDLLNQKVIGNMTVLDKLKALEPALDYTVEEIDEQPIKTVRNF